MKGDIKIMELVELLKDTIEKQIKIINEKDKKIELMEKEFKELEKETTDFREHWIHLDDFIKFRKRIKEIIDKAEVMDYYDLNNVIDDLKKLLEVDYAGGFKSQNKW